MAYRSRMHIQSEILEAASTKTAKTRIMYRVALSYFQTNAYLEELMAMGLLRLDPSDARYSITAKGETFLLTFRRLRELIQ